jgi:succinoglycan biosynthesis protein ExoU
MTRAPTCDQSVVNGGAHRTENACVDVLIAARNRSDTIERAVQSALHQKEVRTVIVIDDGSTDDTAARARRCDPEGNRVIIEELPSSRGPSAARNRALELSQSPWVAILDGDDFFLPGRLGRLLCLSANCDIIADDIAQVQEGHIDLATFEPTLFRGHDQPFLLGLEQFVLGNIRPHGVLRTELGFIKPVIRRSFLDRHDLKYDERLQLGEDYVLYVRALVAGARFSIVPVTGYASVWRADSLSGRHSKEDLQRLRDSDDAIIAAAELTHTQKRALRRHYLSTDSRLQWLRVIDAFKSRRLVDVIAPFCRSPTVSMFLVLRLFEEFQRRGVKRIVFWTGRHG